MPLLPYVLVVLVGIVYVSMMWNEWKEGNTTRGILFCFVDSVRRSEQEKAHAKAFRNETVRSLCRAFGFLEEDMRCLDQEPVRNRLRMLAWRHVHGLALQLAIVNEFKRHLRVEVDKRSDIRPDRLPVADEALALVVAVSDALYEEFQSSLFVAARHPEFQNLFLLYSGEDADRVCSEPNRFLTHGEFYLAHPQWEFVHQVPSRAIRVVLNGKGRQHMAELIDRCLQTCWSNAPYDEIMVRVRDTVRRRAATV